MSVTRYRKGILSIPKLYVPEIDTLSGDLTIKRAGTTREILDGTYNTMYQHLRMTTAKNLVDVLGNTIIDLDDAGGITTLANVASATTFNSIAPQQPFLKGSANSEFVPCAELGTLSNIAWNFNTLATGKSFASGVNVSAEYALLMPTNAYGLKLYVKNVKVLLNDADSGDYLTSCTVYGIALNTATSENTDATDKQAVATVEYSFTAKDVSAYNYIVIQLSCTTNTVTDLKIGGVLVECYYA